MECLSSEGLAMEWVLGSKRTIWTMVLLNRPSRCWVRNSRGEKTWPQTTISFWYWMAAASSVRTMASLSSIVISSRCRR